MFYIKYNFLAIANNTAMNANAFASTFNFLAQTQGNAEKNKKSLQANTPYSEEINTRLTRHKRGRTEARTYNSRFAKARVSCFNESEVLNSSFVHLMKFSSENPCLRKAANRCEPYYTKLTKNKKL
jgi:hypothetical protein